MKPERLNLQSLIFMMILLSTHSGCMHEGGQRSKDGEKPNIHVFAAAGTRYVSDQICDLFEQDNNVDILCSYASSGTLARQISQGAEADIYISANRQWIDFLVEEDLIQSQHILKIAENSLVLASPASQDIKAPEFSSDYPIKTGVNRIAIGDPNYVPAGRYAAEVLEALEWQDQLQDKIILARDVSMALKYAELGACDWAMVYGSEARLSEKVKIISIVPDSLHEPIEFYLALRKGANKQAHLLAEHFMSHRAQFILSSAGFLTENHSK